MREIVRKISIGVFSVGICLLIFFKPTFSADETADFLILSLIIHVLGSIVFILLSLGFNYRIFQKTSFRKIAVLLPCFLVVLNNLPFIALIKGTASIVRADLIWIYALDALFIGVFEELTFRGVFYLFLLENRRSDIRRIFWVTVLSSAVFALCHLANLIEGADFGSTVLQIGYSFLIGGMCSYAFIKTKNIVFPIVLHAIFDFCGNLLLRLGTGHWLNVETIVLTAILALLCLVHVLFGMFKLKPEDVASFYSDEDCN